MKIRIVEPGFQGLTGRIGEVEFVEGVSVESLSRMQVDRLSAVMRVESIEGEAVGAAARLVVLKDMPAEASKPLERLMENEQPEPGVRPKKVYTEEELFDTADKKGAAGLREIAIELNVKGRSIRELIDGILAKQGASKPAEMTVETPAPAEVSETLVEVTG